ncbi:hypothetical protein ACJX0J_024808, partial [Zea mays]
MKQPKIIVLTRANFFIALDPHKPLGLQWKFSISLNHLFLYIGLSIQLVLPFGAMSNFPSIYLNIDALSLPGITESATTVWATWQKASQLTLGAKAPWNSSPTAM